MVKTEREKTLNNQLLLFLQFFFFRLRNNHSSSGSRILKYEWCILKI